MRKLGVLLAFIMCVGVVAVVASPAQAATKHIHAFAPYSKSTDVHNDQDPAGTSVGDSHAGNFKMFNHGKKVGHFDYSCVTTSVSPARETCQATARFTGRGKIMVAGTDDANGGDLHVAITGGTADFNGARGNATLRFRRHGAHFRFNLK
ncbi:MAG: hypothetical protein ABR579_04820 [Actinomycetota bacterium]